ncbi:hypothetical protein FOH38_01745 [Lysinibacillus fusiformis]|nr:hypothetical protein FOH38_01745 [Lysinibacillus fusiformis]
MAQEVNQNAILQAILELSKQVQGVKTEIQQQLETVEKRLEEKMESVEQHLGAKIDGVDAKVHVLSHELLETKADVLMLKQVR